LQNISLEPVIASPVGFGAQQSPHVGRLPHFALPATAGIAPFAMTPGFAKGSYK